MSYLKVPSGGWRHSEQVQRRGERGRPGAGGRAAQRARDARAPAAAAGAPRRAPCGVEAPAGRGGRERASGGGRARRRRRKRRRGREQERSGAPGQWRPSREPLQEERGLAPPPPAGIDPEEDARPPLQEEARLSAAGGGGAAPRALQPAEERPLPPPLAGARCPRRCRGACLRLQPLVGRMSRGRCRRRRGC